MSEQDEQDTGFTLWDVLRAPFPEELIGKLPRIACRDCAQSPGKVCNRHRKQECQVCGNWMTVAHIHLDYVGHAAVTDRLLEADPGWTWEPAYRDVQPQVLAAAVASGNSDVVAQVIANSPPLQTVDGMWIRLTVGDITRLGYGTTDVVGMDREKILIGDAIRNAAMRFGVALDLWSKEDLANARPLSAPTADIEPAEVPPAPADYHRPEVFAAPETVGRDWIGEAQAATTLAELRTIGRACELAQEFTGQTRSYLLARHRELNTEPPEQQTPVVAPAPSVQPIRLTPVQGQSLFARENEQ